MREDKLARALDLIDDDLIVRSAPGVYRRKRVFEHRTLMRWTALAACLVLCILTVTLTVLLGNDPTLPDNRGEYSVIADKLQLMEGADVGEFDNLFPELPKPSDPEGGNVSEPPLADREENGSEAALGVTDDGSAGIIAPEKLLYHGEYLYYLNNGSLMIYTLAGEYSEAVGEYSRNGDAEEMFLSADGKHLTLLVSEAAQVSVVLLDVSDPTQITELACFRATGRYRAARLVNGKLMLFLSSGVLGEPNYEDASTFVPRYDAGEGWNAISAANIFYPERLNSANYTVAYQLNAGTLTHEAGVALLSFEGNILISADGIVVTRSYVQHEEGESGSAARAMLEVAQLSYADNGLVYRGAVAVEGVLRDRHDMNVQNGILRVVTTARTVLYGDEPTETVGAVLHCIDLAQMRVAATVRAFAPDGESVRAVRFEGERVYVYTAGLSVREDPVICLDTSDLAHVTHSGAVMPAGDTVAFGNGYRLAIKEGKSTGLSVVIYSAEDGREICRYQKNVLFSKEYKSYVVDGENGLVGLAVYDAEGGAHYVLLHFDGETLTELQYRPFNGFYKEARSFYHNGYVYVLGWSLTVLRVWLSA